MTILGLFFVIFWSFQTNNLIFTANQCEKMSGVGIQTHDIDTGSNLIESPPV